MLIIQGFDPLSYSVADSPSNRGHDSDFAIHKARASGNLVWISVGGLDINDLQSIHLGGLQVRANSSAARD
jgi:hypothetical protein